MKRKGYRVVALLSLVLVLFIGVRAALSDRTDVMLLLSVIALALFTLLGFMEREAREDVVRRQEEELKMYRMYVRPLEEMVKEIRARQHEFDNHLNAILNLHMTVSDYDELVKKQTEYGGMLYTEERRRFLPLLRLSDKVLAGFLYSKIMEVKERADIELTVLNYTLISHAVESDIIEVVGTLFDNAVEACDETHRSIRLFLDSREDRLCFELWNEVEGLTLGQTARFFEKGYSTKQGGGRRGFGLYNARRIVERVGGQLEVSVEERDGRSFVCFRVEL